jgi:regulatory protein
MRKISGRPSANAAEADVEVPTGTITAIDAHPRRAGRFDVLIDDQPAATLSADVISRLGLRLGMEVDEPLGRAIATEHERVRVYDRAVASLAARGRASVELRRLLVRKGEPVALVDHAVQRLVDEGLLDDAQFARQFTRAKAVGAGMPRRRIERELAMRGVARDVAAESISDVIAEEGVDESASIQRVAERKVRTMARLDPVVQRRRLYAFLARRGYDPGAIAAVVKRVVGAGDADLDAS